MQAVLFELQVLQVGLVSNDVIDGGPLSQV